MKKLLFIALFTLTGSLLWAQQSVPGVTLEDHKGEAFETSTLIDGKTPFILSFWSTVCKPCIQELDSVNEQFMDWNDEVPFRVVAVSTDDVRSSAKAKALANGHGWSDFVLLYDKNQDFKRAMNVNTIPQVYVIDKNGKVVYSHSGYTPGSELELFEAIKKASK